MDTTSRSAPPGPVPRTAPVHWGKVSALVSGQAVVQGGSFALLIAMNWTAVQIGGTSAVSMLMLASTIPRALMLIFGGAVTDLLGPRFVLLRTTAARAVVLAVGALITYSADHLWQLIVVGLTEGALLGLSGPASGVLMPQLAAPEHLGRANSLYAMVLRIAPIVGAPIGAWLISVGQLWEALLAAAVTGLIWLGCLLYVTKGFKAPRREPGVSMFKRSADGFHLLVRNPRLRYMFIASFCLDLAFGWPADVALPSLVSERGWGVSAVGIVLAAFSAGALGSSALGAVMAHRISLFVRLVVTGLGLSVGILVMALMPSVLSLTAVAAGVGLLSGLNGPAIVTVYQQAAPASRMGAAMSTLSLSGIGTAPISIAIFSSLAIGLGVQTTWLICGAIAFGSPLAAMVALRHPIPTEADTHAPAKPEGTTPVNAPAPARATTTATRHEAAERGRTAQAAPVPTTDARPEPAARPTTPSRSPAPLVLATTQASPARPETDGPAHATGTATPTQAARSTTDLVRPAAQAPTQAGAGPAHTTPLLAAAKATAQATTPTTPAAQAHTLSAPSTTGLVRPAAQAPAPAVAGPAHTTPSGTAPLHAAAQAATPTTPAAQAPASV